MQRVTHITDVKPYQIAAKFSNSEIRDTDFTSFVEKFSALIYPVVFAKAKIDDSPTISRDGLASTQELDGTISSCSFDFSPQTLYQLSISQTN